MPVIIVQVKTHEKMGERITYTIYLYGSRSFSLRCKDEEEQPQKSTVLLSLELHTAFIMYENKQENVLVFIFIFMMGCEFSPYLSVIKGIPPLIKKDYIYAKLGGGANRHPRYKIVLKTKFRFFFH